MNTAISPEQAAVAYAGYEDLCLYIDGEFLKGGGRREQDVFDPATGKAFARLPHATREDLDRALAAAQRAFQSWKHSSPLERSRILRKVAELSRERAKDIGRNITLDMGKPVAEAVGETVYFAGEATHTEGHFGTVHGALETGERAAEAVLTWWWE